MKIKLHHAFLFAILVCFALGGNAWAQDAGMSDVEIVDENNITDSEKMLFSPGEGEVKYIPQATKHTVKDSVVMSLREIPGGESKVQEVPAKANEKRPAKSADDSILTFNFLYYIIQKYKLQDIID